MTVGAHSGGTRGPHCCVHLDLDGARHIFRAHGWHLKAERDRLFESGLHSALRLFAELDIQATLFVIAEDLGNPSKLALIREAAEIGHTIASHTTTHRRLPQLPPSERREEIFDSRSRLADALGVAVEGFRAPGFAVDVDILRTVAEGGYLWDSSLIPGRSAAAGLSGIPPVPHRFELAPPLVELPLPTHSPLPLPFHPSYAFVLGLWYFRWGLRRFRRTGAPLILLFHLTEFSDPLDREELPNLRARAFTLSHLSKTRKLSWCRTLFDAIRREYRIVPNSALWAHLEARPASAE